MLRRGYNDNSVSREGKQVIIHGDGTSLWTITHNSDFARAYVGLIGNTDAVGEAFHITTDESVSWNEIYGYIAEAMDVELKACHITTETLTALGPEYDFIGSLIGDKANSVVFDNSKIKRFVPGFKAEVSAREGIRQTVEYVLLHEECQVDDVEFDEWCDGVIAIADRLRYGI